MRPGDDIRPEDHLGLVRLCAGRFRGRGVEYEDLFQAGCLGLLQAAERFDQGRGVKFSTYAVPLILGEMRRLFREGGAVRVSRGLRDLGRKVQREADRAREGGRPAPSLEELARELGVSPERAALALGALQPPLSLTAGEEGETWEIPVEAPEEGMTERLTLYGAMERMDPGDRELLRLRYFLGKTQTQTGEALGMTQVQVSRREKKLLAYMRAAFDQ